MISLLQTAAVPLPRPLLCCSHGENISRFLLFHVLGYPQAVCRHRIPHWAVHVPSSRTDATAAHPVWPFAGEKPPVWRKGQTFRHQTRCFGDAELLSTPAIQLLQIRWFILLWMNSFEKKKQFQRKATKEEAPLDWHLSRLFVREG